MVRELNFTQAIVNRQLPEQLAHWHELLLERDEGQVIAKAPRYTMDDVLDVTLVPTCHTRPCLS